MQTFDIVNFILTELEEENKIHCKCPEGTSRTYKFDLVGREHDTVLIYCDTCEASTAVKIGDPIAANAFLHIDEFGFKLMAKVPGLYQAGAEKKRTDLKWYMYF